MTRKVQLLLVMAMLFSFATVSQAQNGTSSNMSGITDDQTVDPAQTKEWRTGDNPYSARPKDMWEVGVNVGYFFYAGDVTPNFGYGGGLSLRKSLNYSWSLRFDYMYGYATGTSFYDYRNTGDAKIRNIYGNQPYYYDYESHYVHGNLKAIYSFNNIMFHQSNPKFNLYAFMGLGLAWYETNLDATDANGNPYVYGNIPDLPTTTREQRDIVQAAVRDIHNGEYNVLAEQATGIIEFEANGRAYPYFLEIETGLGAAYRVNQRFNIGLEYSIISLPSDLLDGQRWRTGTRTLTQGNDFPQYINLRFNFNLGNTETKTEPLWWLNPNDNIYNDVAELKKRPVLDTEDDDNDGVINSFDQEDDTPEGAPVDVRGVALDSDGDGIRDFEDEERYSPPGYDVDERGVAQVPQPDFLTEAELRRIADEEGWGKYPKTASTGNLDWFLPIIHFNFNSYGIRREAVPELYKVANVLKNNPSLRIVVSGYTDAPASPDYNRVLSYKRAKSAIDYLVAEYGISRDRLILQYGGEESKLIGTTGREFFNRRVEFKTAKGGEQDMGMPSGPSNAGRGGGVNKASY